MLSKNWDGPGKQIARTAATAKKNDGQTPAKTALFLPGNSCSCVKSALAQGTIDENTYIIAVEKDEKTADVIESQLKTLVNEYEIHRGPITTFDPYGCDYEIDFAFFDFCGSLDVDLVQWILDHSDIFVLNAQIAFTFCTLGRSSNFIREVQYELNKNKWGAIKKTVNKQILRKARFIYGSTNDFRVPTITATWAILSSNFKVEIDSCEEYCDTSPMIMVKFNIVSNRNARCGNAMDFLWDCSCGNLMFPYYADDKIAKKTTKIQSLPPWELLNCPSDMPRGQKASIVKKAKKGIRPTWMKPQKWAWNELNPNGIRNKSTR